MLEAQVHSSLLTFLRTTEDSDWPHHLTLARLVARALRLQRSALIQTAATPATYGLSYLTAIALWPETVVVVMPANQQPILQQRLAVLQIHLQTQKSVVQSDHVPEGFPGIVLTTPQVWLGDRFSNSEQFPPGIPTVIDGCDELETWVRAALTQTIAPEDWPTLTQQLPNYKEDISALQQEIWESLRDRPPNPYGDYPLQDEPEQIAKFLETLDQPNPAPWSQWLELWQQSPTLNWATLNPDRTAAQLHLAPLNLAPILTGIWQQQPTVFIGRFLGLERQDGQFCRDRLGLGDLTTVKFAPPRQQELIQLYVPDRLAFPNTPDFQEQLLTQLFRLCRGGMLGQRYGRNHPPEWISPLKRPVVIIVEDTPLRTQVSAALAAEFGSLVQLETTHLAAEGILITGWDFWLTADGQLPPPQLLIIATLPLPSMEHPLVAQQVQAFKQQRQDWFQSYLLPTALQRLQRAVLPVRDRQGVVALLDNRVNHRSYGAYIFQALEPYARINYIDFVN